MDITSPSCSSVAGTDHRKTMGYEGCSKGKGAGGTDQVKGSRQVYLSQYNILSGLRMGNVWMLPWS